MSPYEQVRQAVSLPDAAKRLCIEIPHSHMIRCPFHEDHTPSLRLYDDHFYCFGCGASGDVIDFTARLLGIKPGEAVRKLIAGFNVTPTQANQRTPVSGNREKFAGSILRDYAAKLRQGKRRFAPAAPCQPISEAFAKSCRELPYIEYLQDCLEREPAETVRILQEENLLHELAQALSEAEKGEITA